MRYIGNSVAQAKRNAPSSQSSTVSEMGATSGVWDSEVKTQTMAMMVVMTVGQNLGQIRPMSASAESNLISSSHQLLRRGRSVPLQSPPSFIDYTPMASSNLSVLTKSHNIVAAKKKAKREQIKEVVFDDVARRYVSAK